jgi:DNA-binding NarL/FixJ family response regulator
VEGIVLRSVAAAQLVHCLRRVAAGERCVQQATGKAVQAPDRVGARVLQRLTPKELQIVSLVAEGAKNREIADQLGTKEQVVKNYLRSIYDKTGVSDRLELALFTIHHPALNQAAEQVRSELARTV